MGRGSTWLLNGKLISPRGVIDGDIHIVGGRIASIRRRGNSEANHLNLRGAFLAPGFIDLHVWGDPRTVAKDAAMHGTTAFLSALGPEPPVPLARHLAERKGTAAAAVGARCLGVHLEGPFLNPRRGGALPRRWMRSATLRELETLSGVGGIRLMTLAPERSGGCEAIRWCRRHRIVASMGHSEAEASVAQRAIDAGATAVTHVFNGMPPWHHRSPTLVDVALTDPRLTTMVILDGMHVSSLAFQLLLRCKGVEGIALVTDSIRHQGWDVVERGGAFYTRTGTLAGSDLTMMRAVRNAVKFGGIALDQAVRMASTVPARLLGDRRRGRLSVGARADLVAFDRQFRVLLTIVGGRVAYQRGVS